MKIPGLILVICLWAFVFWIFDIRGGEQLWRQHRALSFATTRGTVRSSTVNISYGSKGSVHYHVDIACFYSVDDRDYYSSRYRYDGHPDNRTAYTISAAHPAGSTVQVYYDPQNPTDALLSAGEDAADVYTLFLTTPICLLFIWLPLRMILDWNLGGSKVAGGVKIISEALVTRVRLPRFQPVIGAVVVPGVLSLVAGILMYAGTIPGPPLMAGGFLLTIVLLGGAAAYGWQYRNVHSGKQDLVIDFAARTVQLPLIYKRRELITVSFSDIRQVVLQKVRHQSKGGAYYTYLVKLEMKDGLLQSLINLNEARAASLAAWLNEKFGLNASAPVLNPED
ncbi:MAG TPA: DUF3592 domain-containing protein [Candidatus Sulfotelmatobacter sp.]|jgi:hypothetical protein|nr:DUF3592 domain-containing protein [Candidatus Sulfotelmatobacter sp.]